MHDPNARDPLYHRKPSKPALRDMRDHIQAIKASGLGNSICDASPASLAFVLRMQTLRRLGSVHT